MDDVLPLAVIGAGVIGLAVAREAALRGLPAMVIEAGDGIGRETSSRNSEVIHAGIYYPPGSLKARACVAGRRRLMRYLRDHDLPHAVPGKLIVATEPGEEAALETIAARAEAAGLSEDEQLRPLTGAEARALEPELRATAALFSPATGIFDSHAYMLALQGEAEAGGADFAFRSPVARIEPGPPHVLVGAEGWRIAAERVVVAAGLGTGRLMRAGPLGGLCPREYFVKGSYFLLRGRGPFHHLVYPVPKGGGLGVHLTLDLGGQARFGPDAEPVEGTETEVDPARGPAFEAAVRRYWPGLPDGALDPGYAGIRPKIAPPPGAEVADFTIQAEAELGVPGLVVLHGIESPGLTSSLALAETVCDHFAERRGPDT